MFALAPYQSKQNDWAWWPDVFSEDQLNTLEVEAALADEEAQTGMEGNSGVNKNLRRSKLKWIHPHSQQHNWMWNTLADVTSRIQAGYFPHIALTGFCEPGQLTRYEARDKGEYGWHQDYGAVVSRKLSLVVQLTDPSKYTGGDFQILLGGNDVQGPERKRGMLCAFPSYQLHRVTPVKKGVRHSLVVWVSGPPFR